MKITDEELKVKARECAELYPEMTFSPTTAYMAGYRAAESADKWVAVSERLPEPGVECVQVILFDSHSNERFRMAANYDGSWILPYDPAQTTAVTHWAHMLPLPETPQTETGL